MSLTLRKRRIAKSVPCIRDLLEKLTVAVLGKKVPAFCGNWNIITVFTRVRQWFIPWTIWIHSTSSYSIYMRSILIFSSHIHLGHSTYVIVLDMENSNYEAPHAIVDSVKLLPPLVPNIVLSILFSKTRTLDLCPSFRLRDQTKLIQKK
jgi:hypothetical protein